MNRFKYIVFAALASLSFILPLAACGAGNSAAQEGLQAEPLPGAIQSLTENRNVEEEEPPAGDAASVCYIRVTADGVNIRSGAGTGYSVRGVAEKSALYCLSDSEGGWYKTGYRNKAGYISSKYCDIVTLEASADAQVESVIAEGVKLLGAPYVYGAVRFHDGKGNLIKGFTADEFDCSSLMQYIFYRGAGVLLQVNTRTQVYQGKKVSAANLERGDLMFFTNAQRKNNKGTERVGHVGLYLGGNYMLHTSSDYAKIESISAQRWAYFIEGRRLLG